MLKKRKIEVTEEEIKHIIKVIDEVFEIHSKMSNETQIYLDQNDLIVLNPSRHEIGTRNLRNYTPRETKQNE